MKTLIILILFCSALVSSVLAIPWPLGDGATGWESIFPITRTYGNFDQSMFWVYVDSTFDYYNFHNAIDISLADAGTENIRAVEAGFFRDCRPTNIDSTEWFAQIFPVDSTYGWHYGHVQGDDGNPLSLDSVSINVDTCAYGQLLGTMSDSTPEMHLHFFRTDQFTFQNGNVGIDNPLDYLDSIPSATNGYTWEILTSTPSVFFLPQHDAIYGDSSWAVLYDPADSLQGGNRNLVIADTLDRSELSDAIDIFYGCNARGYPQGFYVEDSGIPQKIKWSLHEWNTGSSSWESVFTRYVVDLNGEVGAAPEHWKEFRRFYFPYFAWQLFFSPDGDYISCLTNCGDATSWDGINNIEENCWQTDSDNQFNGVTTNPDPSHLRVERSS